MTLEPLWRRINRRPSWERGDPPRFSDYDPTMPVHAAVNRITQRMQRSAAQMDALLSRLEDRSAENRRTRR